MRLLWDSFEEGYPFYDPRLSDTSRKYLMARVRCLETDGREPDSHK